MAFFVFGDLDGPHQAVPIQQIGGVVETARGLFQPFGQDIQGEGGDFGAQGGVFRHFDETVSFQHCLQVHAGPPDEDRQAPPSPDIGENFQETALELEDVELVPRLHDVDQMVGDFAILGQVLAGTDIHPPIDLAGVGGDDLSGEPTGKLNPEPGFSRSGRPEYDEKVEVHEVISVSASSSIPFRRSSARDS